MGHRFNLVTIQSAPSISDTTKRALISDGTQLTQFLLPTGKPMTQVRYF